MNFTIKPVGTLPPPRLQTEKKPSQGFESQLQISMEKQSSVGRAAEHARLQSQLCMLEMTRILYEVSQDSGFGDLPGILPARNAVYPVGLDGRRNLDSAPVSVSALTEPTASKSVQANNASILEELINRASVNHDVAPELIRSMINTESAFNAKAVSSAGAQGLMQLMPDTAAQLGATDPFDPEQNIMAGTRYLRQLLDHYDGDLDHALAAYNWGMGNVDRYGLDRMPEETRNYLIRVKLATG